MGRPKGSKNKATLAKELGMSLEEYNSSLKSTEYNKLHSTDSEYNNLKSTKVESTNKGAEHPNITSNTKFLIPKDEEEGAESTINSSPILTEDNCKEVLKDSTSYLDLSRMLGIGDYHFKILTKLRLCHDCLLALAKSMEENLYEDGLGVVYKEYGDE